MKNITYRLKEYTSGNDASYGVEVLENDVTVCCIPDVFDDKSHAEKLVRVCNENDVDPVHINDVIEDMRREILYECV